MDKSLLDEGPETPAHVFAIRAFKTAFFGTPAPPGTARSKAGVNKTSQEPPVENKPEASISEADKPQQTTSGSPTKSILVTPGAAAGAARRKTVSFSALRNEIKPADLSSSGDGSFEGGDIQKPEDAGAYSDPRRSLFQAQPEPQKAETEASATSRAGFDAAACDNEWEPMDAIEAAAARDETVDLKAPRSRSGQHWKLEYQKEHDKSKTEMQKLIRYSQIAKSYAVKRDDEAVRMRAKLHDAEAKVQEMENTVAQLAGELARSQTGGDAQAAVLDELAKQTAAALRYKQKAEKYQAALEQEERLRSAGPGSLDRAQSQAALESRKLAPGGMSQAEAEALRKQSATLEEENARLRKTVNRFKEDLKRYEERHKIWVQERKRKDERASAKKKVLREQVAKLRTENSRLTGEVERAAAAQAARKPYSQEPDRSHPRKTTSKRPQIPTPKAPEIRTDGQQSHTDGSKSAPTKQMDEVERLRQRLEERLSSSAARPQEESLDLCNLPSDRDKVRVNVQAKERFEGRRGTSRVDRGQTKPENAALRLNDFAISARQDLAAILAEKERVRSSRDEGKENLKPVAVT